MMSMLDEIDKMGPEKRAEFLRDRAEALLSLDSMKIIAYAEKYSVPGLAESAALAEGNPEGAFWVIVHKARTGALDLPLQVRRESCEWLLARGHSIMDEGGVSSGDC